MVTEGVGLTRGQRAADAVTKFCGSWSLILIATLFIAAWMSGSRWFDPFPWLGLNLVFTIVEFYQGPLILMSQNRQMEQDREADLAARELLHTEVGEIRKDNAEINRKLDLLLNHA